MLSILRRIKEQNKEPFFHESREMSIDDVISLIGKSDVEYRKLAEEAIDKYTSWI